MFQAISALVAWGSRVIVPLFGFSRIFVFIKKLLSFGLFTVGVPLAINWGAYKVAENFSPQIFEAFGLSAQSITLVGVGAWMADKLQIPLCFSIFMGFVAQTAAVKLTKMGGMFSKFSTDRYK